MDTVLGCPGLGGEAMQSMPGQGDTLLGVGVSSTEESSKRGLEGVLGTGQKALMAQCIWNIL